MSLLSPVPLGLVLEERRTSIAHFATAPPPGLEQPARSAILVASAQSRKRLNAVAMRWVWPKYPVRTTGLKYHPKNQKPCSEEFFSSYIIYMRQCLDSRSNTVKPGYEERRLKKVRPWRIGAFLSSGYPDHIPVDR